MLSSPAVVVHISNSSTLETDMGEQANLIYREFSRRVKGTKRNAISKQEQQPNKKQKKKKEKKCAFKLTT